MERGFRAIEHRFAAQIEVSNLVRAHRSSTNLSQRLFVDGVDTSGMTSVPHMHLVGECTEFD